MSIEKGRILFSTELIDELSRVSTYARLKPYFGAGAIVEMLINLEAFIDLIEVKSAVFICRDNKDNFLLSHAKDGRANFLLTGDKDLLILQKLEKTKIITITQFFEDMKL